MGDRLGIPGAVDFLPVFCVPPGQSSKSSPLGPQTFCQWKLHLKTFFRARHTLSWRFPLSGRLGNDFSYHLAWVTNFLIKAHEKQKYSSYTGMCIGGGAAPISSLISSSGRGMDFNRRPDHVRRASAFALQKAYRTERSCLRPYHVENTGSRPITEVKQRRARLVLGWVTAWEHRVQLASSFLFFFLF